MSPLRELSHTNNNAPSAPTAPVKLVDEPPPPPPPEADEIFGAAPEPETDEDLQQPIAPKTGFDAVLDQIPTASTQGMKALVGGHAVLFFFWLTGTMPLSLVSLVAVWALIANGISTTLSPKTAVLSFTAADLLPAIERGIDFTLHLARRYHSGEPRLTFLSALGAWGLTFIAPHVSALKLAWIGYVLATFAIVFKFQHASGQTAALAPHAAALQAKAASFVQSVEVPAKVQIGVPAAAFAYWFLFVDTYHKLLTLGLSLLGYKAWASPEAVEKFVTKLPSGEAVGVVASTLKNRARRMTMGTAGDMMRMASAVVDTYGKTPAKEE